jgi:hypothetical protein
VVLVLGVLAGAAAAPAGVPPAAASGSAGAAPPQAPTGATGVTGATGPATLALAAPATRLGFVSLSVTGASGPVRVSEIVPGAAPVTLTTLRPRGGAATLGRAAAWRCDRRVRTFAASDSVATRTVTVTTPSCATRLAATVLTSRVHRDHPLTVVITDRWGLGALRVGACVSHVGPRPCPTVTIAPGRRDTDLRLRAGAAGRPALEVFDAYENLRLRLDVLASGPVLLATGDSEMQVLDGDLASDLGGPAGARVISDARQSSAISSPFVFDWPAHAVAQVAADRPDIVAMFLGGNEGFALGGVNCCSAAWSRRYAIKVEGMMRTYRQHGAASVYWFLIPTPSKPQFVRVVDAVNRGIVLAAAHFRRGVHVFDLRPVFSPGERYLGTLSYGGRSITVHESDGFHLSASADVIVARLFLSRLRRDGLL